MFLTNIPKPNLREWCGIAVQISCHAIIFPLLNVFSVCDTELLYFMVHEPWALWILLICAEWIIFRYAEGVVRRRPWGVKPHLLQYSMWIYQMHLVHDIHRISTSFITCFFYLWLKLVERIKCLILWVAFDLGLEHWHSRIRRDQQYALIVLFLYTTYWLLHVSAVACHHQGAY
jgi:hypothetical protein